MNILLPSDRALLWISLAGEAAVGPAFLVAGYAMGLVFGLGAYFYVLCCAVVVPLLMFGAGRFKLVAWQLGVASLTLSVIGDNIGNHAISEAKFLEWLSYSGPRDSVILPDADLLITEPINATPPLHRRCRHCGGGDHAIART